MNRRNWVLGAVFSAITLGVHAQTATDAEIRAAVSDRTYQGTMLGINDAFTEYYAADGTIRGDGYTGKWRVSNNQMCFTYGDNPEKCWVMDIHGPSMIMFKDGAVDGNGILMWRRRTSYHIVARIRLAAGPAPPHLTFIVRALNRKTRDGGHDETFLSNLVHAGYVTGSLPLLGWVRDGRVHGVGDE